MIDMRAFINSGRQSYARMSECRFFIAPGLVLPRQRYAQREPLIKMIVLSNCVREGRDDHAHPKNLRIQPDVKFQGANFLDARRKPIFLMKIM